MTQQTYRAWINQPSTSQLLHHLHGKRCIVQDTKEETVHIWFTEGDVHSMQVPRLCVSRINLSATQGLIQPQGEYK